MATTKVSGQLVDLNEATSENGLKMPSGTEVNRPTNATGQIRNNTNETSEFSSSCQEYYNGTEWKKITNVNPVPASNIITLTQNQIFSRNQTTPTNNTRYTYSFWVKWDNFGTIANMWLTTGQYSSNPREEIQWDNGSSRWFLYYDGGASNQGAWYAPTMSAPTDGVWYHYCFQKIAQQAPVLYINGTSIGTWTSSAAPNPPSGDGTTTRINSGLHKHDINGRTGSTNGGINGSYAYCQFIDGSIQAPSVFTSTISSLTIPAAYTGTWGNNGWQLLFSNTGAIGTDTSGNGNNFSTVPAATTGTDKVYYL
jgi:hypothetical protein